MSWITDLSGRVFWFFKAEGDIKNRPGMVLMPTASGVRRWQQTQEEPPSPQRPYSDPESAIIHGLRIVAGRCDRAEARDNCGFSKFDTEIGHDLARRDRFVSEKQARLALSLVRKYQKQIRAVDPAVLDMAEKLEEHLEKKRSAAESAQSRVAPSGISYPTPSHAIHAALRHLNADPKRFAGQDFPRSLAEQTRPLTPRQAYYGLRHVNEHAEHVPPDILEQARKFSMQEAERQHAATQQDRERDADIARKKVATAETFEEQVAAFRAMGINIARGPSRAGNISYILTGNTYPIKQHIDILKAQRRAYQYKDNDLWKTYIHAGAWDEFRSMVGGEDEQPVRDRVERTDQSVQPAGAAGGSTAVGSGRGDTGARSDRPGTAGDVERVSAERRSGPGGGGSSQLPPGTVLISHGRLRLAGNPEDSARTPEERERLGERLIELLESTKYPTPKVELLKEFHGEIIFDGSPDKFTEGQKHSIGMILTAREAGRRAFLLGDGTGMGKTAVSLAALKQSATKRNLIVVPNDGIAKQWQRTGKEAFGIDISDEMPGSGSGTWIMTYNAMLKEFGNNIPSFDTIIFDEAHAKISKSWRTQMGKTALNLARRAGFTIYATATPFERPQDSEYLELLGLWKKGEYRQWAEAHGVAFEEKYYPGASRPAVIQTHHGSRKEFGGRVGDMFQLRAQLMREGVGSFKEIDLPVELQAHFSGDSVSGQFADIVNKAVAITDRVMSSAGGMTPAAMRTHILKRLLDYGKLDRAVELAVDALKKGKKVPIFVSNVSPFSFDDIIAKAHAYRAWAIAGRDPHSRPTSEHMAMLGFEFERAGMRGSLPSPTAYIVEQLRKRGIEAGEYTGRETTAKREKLKKDFQDDNGKTKVIVSSIAAGGTGLSLHDRTGRQPREQINIGLPWTAKEFSQVRGRTYRMGTKSDVVQHMLLTDHPHERKIAKMLAARLSGMNASVRGIKADHDAKRLDMWEEWLFGDVDDDALKALDWIRRRGDSGRVRVVNGFVIKAEGDIMHSGHTYLGHDVLGRRHWLKREIMNELGKRQPGWRPRLGRIARELIDTTHRSGGRLISTHPPSSGEEGTDYTGYRVRRGKLVLPTLKGDESQVPKVVQSAMEDLGKMGITWESLVRNLDNAVKNALNRDWADDRTVHGWIRWYHNRHDEQKRFVRELRAKYGHVTTQEAVAGVVAALSPQFEWEPNWNLARTVLYVMAAGGKIRITDTVMQKIQAIADRHNEVVRGYKERIAAGESGDLTPMEGAKIQHEFRDRDDITVADLLGGIKVGEQIDLRQRYRELLKKGKSPEDASREVAIFLPLSPGGTSAMGAALRIAMGEDPNLVLNGPKVRSFYNNMLNPSSDHPDGHATVDSHQVRIMTGMEWPELIAAARKAGLLKENPHAAQYSAAKAEVDKHAAAEARARMHKDLSAERLAESRRKREELSNARKAAKGKDKIVAAEALRRHKEKHANLLAEHKKLQKAHKDAAGKLKLATEWHTRISKLHSPIESAAENRALDKVLGSQAKYDLFRHAINHVASKYGLRGHELQALVWSARRQMDADARRKAREAHGGRVTPRAEKAYYKYMMSAKQEARRHAESVRASGGIRVDQRGAISA